MKYTVLSASALALAATSGHAGGIDRSGQSIDAIFKPGTYAEFSFGSVNPNVSGTSIGVAPTGPASPGNVGDQDSDDVTPSYLSFGAAFKHDYNDRFSVALIFDQPFGADVDYDSGTEYYAQGSTATLRSNAISALARYKFNENVAVHGGVRYQTLFGNAEVNSFRDVGAPPALQVLDYEGDLEEASGWGYTLGATYEIPDIALRVALTYNSRIKTEHDSTESQGSLFNPNGTFSDASSTTEIETPQSVNLAFQSGIAADTLLFGGVRWVDWSEFEINPDGYERATGGRSLVSYDHDTYTYSLGVGRRFSDMWAGSVSIGYEAEQDGIASNLGPTDGFWSLGLGGSYTAGPLEIAAGVRYVWIGDAETANGTISPGGEFENNDALGVGLRVGYTF